MILLLTPLLFHLEAPFSTLLMAMGLVGCGLVIYFDYSLPGREIRQHSLLVRLIHAAALFATLAVIHYPASRREGIPLWSFLLTFAVPFLASVLINYWLWHYQRKKNSRR